MERRSDTCGIFSLLRRRDADADEIRSGHSTALYGSGHSCHEQGVQPGELRVQIGKVFHINQIVEAHRLMEENKAGGKIVVLT